MRPFGLLNIHKPQGPTSHDIVARVRRGTRVKKVGHAGTLDPMATGVLVLCLGPATRLSEYVMESPKTYRARVQLGTQTDTYDAEGEVIAHNPVEVSETTLKTALDRFRGTIQQVPPMYSAIKQGGKKLYELARAGQDVERQARTVTIYRLDLIAFEFPIVELEIECSPGTYVRSLAHDVGQAVEVGGHLTALERAASGQFTLELATEWAAFESAMIDGTWQAYLLPPDLALGDAPALHLSPAEIDHIRQGRVIPVAQGSVSADIARAYDSDGTFFAVVERRGDHWKPHKVFNL